MCAQFALAWVIVLQSALTWAHGARPCRSRGVRVARTYPSPKPDCSLVSGCVLARPRTLGGGKRLTSSTAIGGLLLLGRLLQGRCQAIYQSAWRQPIQLHADGWSERAGRRRFQRWPWMNGATLTGPADGLHQGASWIPLADTDRRMEQHEKIAWIKGGPGFRCMKCEECHFLLSLQLGRGIKRMQAWARGEMRGSALWRVR